MHRDIKYNARSRDRNNYNYNYNYNVCIAGSAGSGKNILIQEMILSTLSVGGKAFVFDYGKNFKHLCQVLDGDYIQFNQSNPVSLNPFAFVPIGSDSRSARLRADFLEDLALSWLRISVPDEVLAYKLLATLTQCMQECWEAKKTEADIDDMILWLSTQSSLECQELTKMMFNYTKDGAYGQFFSRKAELTLNANLIVIDMEHLRHAPSLIVILLRIILIHTKDSIEKSKRLKPNLIIFPELTSISTNPLILELIEECSREMRRCFASLVVATQTLTDFEKFGIDAARIFEEASFKIIFKQSADTLCAMRNIPLFESYVKTDTQFDRMHSIGSKTGEYSECIIWSEGVNGDICRLRIDPFTSLLISTNPTDKQLIADHRAAGMSLKDAINIILEERGHAS